MNHYPRNRHHKPSCLPVQQSAATPVRCVLPVGQSLMTSAMHRNKALETKAGYRIPWIPWIPPCRYHMDTIWIPIIIVWKSPTWSANVLRFWHPGWSHAKETQQGLGCTPFCPRPRSIEVLQEHIVAGRKRILQQLRYIFCLHRYPIGSAFQPSKLIEDFDNGWVWP